MHRYLLIVLLLCSPGLRAQQPLHVVTHNRVTINTNPAEGSKFFPAWGVFPPRDVSVRKIMMHVTLGCPDTMPCAHWDYLDRITLKRAGSVSAKSLDYELGRMLTPYGSIFTPGWNWTWSADVTDFSSVLRDSIEIEYTHTGYETPTVGWSLTIDFEIVTGPEILRPVSITRLWEGSFRYGDPALDIEKELAPISFRTDPGMSIARLRIQHTGHGMDEPRGCSEFCPRWRDLLLDGKVVDHTNLWKNCGDNPLYPQGGTWIYDRAWWCPGNLQPADVIDLRPSPGEHVLDLNMEPYTVTGNIQANEAISSYLVKYEGPFAKNDVAAEQVIAPNKDQNYTRYNPAVFSPLIVIRNLGSETLRSLVMEYGTAGFPSRTYTWKGELGFNKSALVTLPGLVDQQAGDNRFRVTLRNPNGKKDAWEGDNTLESVFSAPPVIPCQLVLQLLTNNKPGDNRISITDKDGKVVFEKKPEDLAPKTLYHDTLNLAPGPYALILSDTAGDGLEFWYEVEAGYGYMRLLTPDGRLVHNFESDCGDGQLFSFLASPLVPADTSVTQYAFVLWPRRTTSTLNLDVHADKVGTMDVTITSDGRPVERHYYASVKQHRFTYDVSFLPKGRYIIEVMMDGQSRFKRRFNKE